MIILHKEMATTTKERRLRGDIKVDKSERMLLLFDSFWILSGYPHTYKSHMPTLTTGPTYANWHSVTVRGLGLNYGKMAL